MRTDPRPHYPKVRVTKANRAQFDQRVYDLVESGCYTGRELIERLGYTQSHVYRILARKEIAPYFLTKKQRMKIINGALK